MSSDNKSWFALSILLVLITALALTAALFWMDSGRSLTGPPLTGRPLTGPEIVYRLPIGSPEVTGDAVQGVLERRLHALGEFRFAVRRGGDGEVVVLLDPDAPGVEQVRRVIQSGGRLSIHLVSNSAPSSPDPMADPPRDRDAGHGIAALPGSDGSVPIDIGPGRSIAGRVLEAGVFTDDLGRPSAQVTFDARTESELRRLSSANPGRQLAIVVDGEAMIVATLRTVLGASVAITGDELEPKISELVAILEGGPLPVELEFVRARAGTEPAGQ